MGHSNAGQVRWPRKSHDRLTTNNKQPNARKISVGTTLWIPQNLDGYLATADLVSLSLN